KNSLALSFGLGSILAAIKFRNTLDDTKDASFFFLTTGIGLAAGVQALGVALVLSLGFNLVVLGLWVLDIGRAPVQMGGVLATMHLNHTMAHENSARNGRAVLHEEALRSLDALAIKQLRKQLKKENERRGRRESAKRV